MLVVTTANELFDQLPVEVTLVKALLETSVAAHGKSHQNAFIRWHRNSSHKPPLRNRSQTAIM